MQSSIFDDHDQQSGRVSLNLAQERVWNHLQLQPETSLYSLAFAWEIHGKLDVDRFTSVFERIQKKYPLLRSALVEDRGKVEFCLREECVPLVVDNWDDEEASESHVSSWLKQKSEKVLNVGEGELLCGSLLRISRSRHLFILNIHQIIFDNVSAEIFVSALAEAYRNSELAMDEVMFDPEALDLSFRSESGQNVLGQTKNDFWNVPPSHLTLPTDKVRPELFDHAGIRLELKHSDSLYEQVFDLSKSKNVLPEAVILTAWNAYLLCLTNCHDFSIGIDHSAFRDSSFVDRMGWGQRRQYLRVQSQQNQTFEQTLLRTNKELCALISEAGRQTDAFLNSLSVPTDLSHTPFMSAGFGITHLHTSIDLSPGISIKPIGSIYKSAATDIFLNIEQGSRSFKGNIIFARSLFSSNVCEALASSFEHFFGRVLSAPTLPLKEVALVDPASEKRIRDEFNNTYTEYADDRSIDEKILEIASRHNEKTAVVSSDESLTYGELEQEVGQIASGLVARGIGDGDIVGVMMDRSPKLISSILAIWRVGAAYLPLDPSYPDARLLFMIEDASPKLILVKGTINSGLKQSCNTLLQDVGELSGEGLRSDVTKISNLDERLAYLIYTSGSSGKPKGVLNHHRAINNFINAMAICPGMKSEDTLLYVTTIAFDISILELFLPLSVGGTVVLASEEEAHDGYALADLIEKHNVTVLQGTPATWQLLLDSDWSGANTLKALCGGEAMPSGLAAELLPKTDELWNMYGPTETTVWSTCKRITSTSEINIGKPIANTRIYIVDEFNRSTPLGVPGEVLIAGHGVALGYLNRRQLTEQKFELDRYVCPTSKLYRTGDRARWLPNGEIDLVGRIDQQVKLRGFRIELGEIEHVLNSHPLVSKSVVALKKDKFDNDILVAYVSNKTDQKTTPSEARKWLRNSVPDYMVPQYFEELDSFPLTANGKIDRSRLPDVSSIQGVIITKLAPQSVVEKAISQIWCDLLEVENVSVSDNFMDLGGDSLRAARMLGRLRREYGWRIPPRTAIFDTLGQMAEAIQANVMNVDDGGK